MRLIRGIIQNINLDVRLYIANHVISHIPIHIVRLFFYRAVLRIKIKSGSSIFMGACFYTLGRLEIGTNSTINQQCRLDARGGLTIGDNVSVSAMVCILTAEHDVQSPTFAGLTRAVHIHDYVFIGTRAMILPGITIGKGAVVAAGAIVTKNVAPYSIVAGMPAKPIGQRNENLTYNVRYRRLLN